MTLFKEGNRADYLVRWKSAVCATVSNSVGIFADTTAAVAAQFGPVCREAQRLSSESLVLLAVCVVGAILVLSARAVPSIWRRICGLVLLVATTVYVLLRRSGFVLLHADQAEVPLMHDGSTYMLNTQATSASATPFINILFLSLALPLAASAIGFARAPASPMNVHQSEEQEAPLLFWAVTPQH